MAKKFGFTYHNSKNKESKKGSPIIAWVKEAEEKIESGNFWPEVVSNPAF
jgi:hypothetical protein